MVRPCMYDHYKMDNFPLGTNAVVAVISYTGLLRTLREMHIFHVIVITLPGFDMEDAMILNKGSFHRGFAHGTIYQTQFIDLSTHGKLHYPYWL